jgi:hypothetical protein
MIAVTSLLADHVAFQLDSVDRIFVAGQVPELRHEGELVCFLIELVARPIARPRKPCARENLLASALPQTLME